MIIRISQKITNDNFLNTKNYHHSIVRHFVDQKLANQTLLHQPIHQWAYFLPFCLSIIKLFDNAYKEGCVSHFTLSTPKKIASKSHKQVRVSLHYVSLIFIKSKGKKKNCCNVTHKSNGGTKIRQRRLVLFISAGYISASRTVFFFYIFFIIFLFFNIYLL